MNNKIYIIVPLLAIVLFYAGNFVKFSVPALDVEKLRGGGFGIFRGMKPFTQEDELESHD